MEDTHDEILSFEHLKPHFDEILPPPPLRSFTTNPPQGKNNLPAVRRPWLSVMDRSGAKREQDKVCVFHYNNFSVWGSIFFFFVQSYK